MAAKPIALDDPHDLCQILYTSLLKLHFDVASVEHELRTPVNPKMFLNMNKKLGQTILHFLFTYIDPEKAAKVFRDCWPIVDRKQESEFIRATFDWYKSLQQSYGQPIPAIVGKTFFSPGGPKFISVLVTLTTVALHSTVNRKAPDFSLLHFPTLSRNPNQNQAKLLLLQASKKFLMQEFITKQKEKEKILLKLQERAKSAVQKYRNLCAEGERSKIDLQSAFESNTRLTPSQKEKWMTLPVFSFEEEILNDTSQMNNDAGAQWNRVAKFQDVELKSRKVLAPVLEGTTTHLHVDGSIYLPMIPEIVHKEHAPVINKMNLQGLYCDGKLNLLSLVQYSNLALQSLQSAVSSTPSFARPESNEELLVQSGRATSLSESMNDLATKVNLLIPSLMESVSTLKMKVYSADSWNGINIEGRHQLCPPTPPLSLANTSVGSNYQRKLAPLQLTPAYRRRTVMLDTPTQLLSTITMTRAAKRSPKADVIYSPLTHKDESILLDMSMGQEDEAGLTMDLLTVDCRSTYQINKEKRDQLLNANKFKIQERKKGPRSAIPGPSRLPRMLLKENNSNAKQTASEHMLSNSVNKTIIQESKTRFDDNENALMDRLADMLAQGKDNSNDNGALELMMSSLNNTDMEVSSGDSGCVAGTSDTESLSDLIEKMNITPKETQRRNRDRQKLRHSFADCTLSSPSTVTRTDASGTTSSLLSPSSTRYITPLKPVCVQDNVGHFTRLIDVTPFNVNYASPKVCIELSSEDPFKTPMPLGHDAFKTSISSSQNTFKTSAPTSQDTFKTPTASVHDFLKTPVTVIKKNNKESSSLDDLKAKMSFISQSPVRDTNTPFASKLLSKFEGINFGNWQECKTLKPATELKMDGKNVDELKHLSKQKLSNFMEQANKIKMEFPTKVESMKERRKTVAPSKFLFFVKNVKCGKDANKQNEAQNEKHSYEIPIESVSQKINSHHSSSNVNNLHSNMASLEELLGEEDCETTLIESKSADNTDNPPEEEVFIDASEFENTVLETSERRSSYLPRNSIFETLTESILLGELPSSLLNDSDVRAEVRRESISSRRQSLMSAGRPSMSSNFGISDDLVAYQSILSVECNGILDESDSCLLSTSLDDFDQL